MRNVICLKWGSKYGAQYVNILHKMVSRHLSGDYRFVCFTDDSIGLLEEIEVMPLPRCPLPDRPQTEAWRKLGLFQRGIGIDGPTLFLDLDVVITESLEPFFDIVGEFCIIHNWTHLNRRVGNSSVFRFVPGQHLAVFDRYEKNPQQVADAYPNEQVFLSECIDHQVGLTFWPAAWCKSFKKHCLPKGLARLLRPSTVPKDARIVVFHGNPNPPEAASRWWFRSEKRFRVPKFMRPARWILKYYR